MSDYDHNHPTRNIMTKGECPSCDRHHFKQEAKLSFQNYDCDPVGGNCPEDAISFIQGYIEGAAAESTDNARLREMLKVALGALEFYADPETWIKRDHNGWDQRQPKGDTEQIRGYKHPVEDNWIGTVSVGGKQARTALAQIRALGIK